MAKKKSKSSQKTPVVQGVAVGASEPEDVPDTSKEPNDEDNNETEYDEDPVEEEMELLQVDLGDMIKMKQVLDEGVSAALLDHVPEEYV